MSFSQVEINPCHINSITASSRRKLALDWKIHNKQSKPKLLTSFDLRILAVGLTANLPLA